jgi:hypothetical protein
MVSVHGWLLSLLLGMKQGRNTAERHSRGKKATCFMMAGKEKEKEPEQDNSFQKILPSIYFLQLGPAS